VNQPSTAREALIVEALGDIAHLLDRVEALRPALDDTQQRLAQANAELAHGIVAFEGRMVAITESTKIKAVEYIAHNSAEVARRCMAQQTQVMTNSARAIFNTELGTSLQRLASSLQVLLNRVERIERPWDTWLTHAATACVASAGTWAVAMHLLPK
jgi:hypothetical protein